MIKRTQRGLGFAVRTFEDTAALRRGLGEEWIQSPSKGNRLEDIMAKGNNSQKKETKKPKKKDAVKDAPKESAKKK